VDSRLVKYILLTACGLLLAFIIAVKMVLPPFAIEKIESFVNENCETCHLSLGGLDASLLTPGEISFTGVDFKSGIAGAQQVDAKAARVRMKFSLADLYRKKPHLQLLDFEKPDVTFTDGDKHTHPKPKDSDFTFVIERMVAHDGEFTYVRDHLGTHAILHIHDIQVQAGAIGNVPDLKAVATRASALARIEKSGEVGIDLSVPVFAKPLRLDVDLKIKDQNLADVTPFFKENAGVILKGVMLSGHGPGGI
jgi:hypothetical protein